MEKHVMSINEIRPQKNVFIKSILIGIVFECILVLSSILFDLWMLFFAFAMLLTIIHTYLDFRNTSVIYDQNGITITTFTNRHFFYSWDDVISVQDNYADKGPTDSNARRVLKIELRNHESQSEYFTCPFSSFSGIYQFLDYYECNIKQNCND